MDTEQRGGPELKSALAKLGIVLLLSESAMIRAPTSWVAVRLHPVLVTPDAAALTLRFIQGELSMRNQNHHGMVI